MNSILDSHILETGLEIFKNQAKALNSIILIAFLLRIIVLMVKYENINGYFTALRDLVLCMFLLFNFDSILNIITQLPFIAQSQIKISPSDVTISKIELMGLSLIDIINWISVFSYWISMGLYIIIMFILMVFGPIIITVGTIWPAYFLLKTYFISLTLISIWPIGWHFINIITSSIVNSIDYLKDGVANGFIIGISSLIKSFIPLILYLAKNGIIEKGKSMLGKGASLFKSSITNPTSMVSTAGKTIYSSSLKSASKVSPVASYAIKATKQIRRSGVDRLSKSKNPKESSQGSSFLVKDKIINSHKSLQNIKLNSIKSNSLQAKSSSKAEALWNNLSTDKAINSNSKVIKNSNLNKVSGETQNLTRNEGIKSIIGNTLKYNNENSFKRQPRRDKTDSKSKSQNQGIIYKNRPFLNKVRAKKNKSININQLKFLKRTNRPW